MAAGSNGERAQVTGGPGLIGSHIADGYPVRILDNLQPQARRNGKPSWAPKEAEFLRADVRDPDAATPGAVR